MTLLKNGEVIENMVLTVLKGLLAKLVNCWVLVGKKLKKVINQEKIRKPRKIENLENRKRKRKKPSGFLKI